MYLCNQQVFEGIYFQDYKEIILFVEGFRWRYILCMNFPESIISNDVREKAVELKEGEI